MAKFHMRKLLLTLMMADAFAMVAVGPGARFSAGKVRTRKGPTYNHQPMEARRLRTRDGRRTDQRTEHNILISQAEVDRWNAKLATTAREITTSAVRWSPVISQWATFSAITGVGAGALALGFPMLGYPASLGMYTAKLYMSTVGAGTMWTLAHTAFMGGNERIIRGMGGQPASKRIAGLVASTARDAGLKTSPTAWIIPSAEPNAFAMTPGLLAWSPHAVAVTQGLVDTLTSSELHAVIAHEVGHIRHNDCGRALQTASMMSGLHTAVRIGFRMLRSEDSGKSSSSSSSSSKNKNKSDESDGDSSGAVAVALVGVGSVSYAASSLLRLQSSRAAEYAADAAAVELVPDGGIHLASALKKIESSNKPRDVLGGDNSIMSHAYFANNPPTKSEIKSGGREKSESAFDKTVANIRSLFRTHPHTADRVALLLPPLAQTPAAAAVLADFEVARASKPETAFVAFGKEVAEVLEDGLW